MVSVASVGAADRIAARILFSVVRAGSGTPARYSSTVFAVVLLLEVPLLVFAFLMRQMLQEFPYQIHAPWRCPFYTSARRANFCGDRELTHVSSSRMLLATKPEEVGTDV